MIKKIIKIIHNNINIFKEIMKKTNKNIFATIFEIIKYEIKYGINLEDYLSFQFYDMKEENVSTYFTYRMNDKLVDKSNLKSKKYIFNDKEVFDKVFEKYLGRKCSPTNIDFEEFSKFVEGLDMIFYKKKDGNRGIGAKKIIINDYNSIKDLYDDIQKMGDGIIEEVVKPNHIINELCDSGLSTIRLVTYNKNNKLEIIDSVFMITNGSIVNCEVTGGGLSACIDVETGEVITDGVDVNRKFYERHPISGIKIKGIKIPYWNDVLKMAEEIYNKVPEVKYVGWDIAITEEGPILIEGNASWPSHRIWQIPYLREKKGKKEKIMNIIK